MTSSKPTKNELHRARVAMQRPPSREWYRATELPAAATSELALTWMRVPCQIFKWRYDLQGLPKGSFGSSYRSQHKGLYVAQAWIGGRYLRHLAGTPKAAMARLNRDIDRKSIGLLNVDVVTFKTVTGK